MLVAAMVLGLYGGLSYFVGGGTAVVADLWGSTPWWAVAMIPIGVIGALGGAMARSSPSLAGIVLLLAGVSALAVGFASAEEASQSGAAASSLLSYLPIHPLMGSFLFNLPALIPLIIGGCLALAAARTAETNSAT